MVKNVSSSFFLLSVNCECDFSSPLNCYEFKLSFKVLSSLLFLIITFVLYIPLRMMPRISYLIYLFLVFRAVSNTKEDVNDIIEKRVSFVCSNQQVDQITKF